MSQQVLLLAKSQGKKNPVTGSQDYVSIFSKPHT